MFVYVYVCNAHVYVYCGTYDGSTCLKNIGFGALHLEPECEKFRFPLASSDTVGGPFDELTVLCVSVGLYCWGGLMRWSRCSP